MNQIQGRSRRNWRMARQWAPSPTGGQVFSKVMQTDVLELSCHPSQNFVSLVFFYEATPNYFAGSLHVARSLRTLIGQFATSQACGSSSAVWLSRKRHLDRAGTDANANASSSSDHSGEAKHVTSGAHASASPQGGDHLWQTSARQGGVREQSVLSGCRSRRRSRISPGNAGEGSLHGKNLPGSVGIQAFQRRSRDSKKLG